MLYERHFRGRLEDRQMTRCPSKNFMGAQSGQLVSEDDECNDSDSPRNPHPRLQLRKHDRMYDTT